MATLPGEPLYRAYGFRETDRAMVPLPDGTELARRGDGAAVRLSSSPGRRAPARRRC